MLLKSAQQRLAGFLLEMAKRPGVTAKIELPMSRRDIGDCLGLTLETVSRVLSQLQKGVAIAVPSIRQIGLRKCAVLMQLDT
jgi:CRP-like cAMP-binding protein